MFQRSVVWEWKCLLISSQLPSLGRCAASYSLALDHRWRLDLWGVCWGSYCTVLADGKSAVLVAGCDSHALCCWAEGLQHENAAENVRHRLMMVKKAGAVEKLHQRANRLWPLTVLQIIIEVHVKVWCIRQLVNGCGRNGSGVKTWEAKAKLWLVSLVRVWVVRCAGTRLTCSNSTFILNSLWPKVRFTLFLPLWSPGRLWHQYNLQRWMLIFQQKTNNTASNPRCQ